MVQVVASMGKHRQARGVHQRRFDKISHICRVCFQLKRAAKEMEKGQLPMLDQHTDILSLDIASGATEGFLEFCRSPQ